MKDWAPDSLGRPGLWQEIFKINLPDQRDLRSALSTLSSLPKRQGKVLVELVEEFSCSFWGQNLRKMMDFIPVKRDSWNHLIQITPNMDWGQFMKTSPVQE